MSRDYLTLGVGRRRFLRDAALLSSVFALPSLSFAEGLLSKVKGGILRYGAADGRSSEKLDPATATNGSSTLITQLIFETLVVRDPNLAVAPGLAESWNLSEDGLSWTFKLRPDVLFHDGSAFTADDVKWSLSRILDEKIGSPSRGRLIASFDADGIQVKDSLTLTIHTKRVDTLLPLALTRPYCAVVKNNTTPLASVASAVGTGPFKVKSFTPGQAWETSRWEKHWQVGYASLDAIQCVAILDQNTRVQAVKSGAVDIVDGIEPVILKKLANDSTVTLARMPSNLWYGIFLDETVKPFDDIRVRQAIKYALDRNLLLDVVYGGFGSVSPDVPVPNFDKLFPSAATLPSYDIAKAKALLSEAGYPDGLEFEIFTSDTTTGFVNLAIVFGESLKAAGIKVKINQWPKETYWDQVWGKRPAYIDFMLRRHAHDTLDAAYVKGAPFNGSKFDGNGAMRSAINDALAERDEQKQAIAYKNLLAEAANNSGVIIPAFIDRTLVMHKGVEGNPFATEDPIALGSVWKN
ncbi:MULTISPECIES: ABC transporter substrate-binding protein [Pseudomonas]|uniref:ABC transporter substrate-binding protein n=1 Tax=Pseudomonas sp. FW305-E2 TaxID=2075558 RepID=UPI0013048B03|nr:MULTISPECIES: ABC transporter substrate-binding protein [Pseudomonas]